MTDVYFTAWAFDPKFHALTGAIRIMPEVSAHGERLYRVPPCATLIEPPEEQPGRRAVWMESTGHWIEVSDHRGETWFDPMRGSAVVIERLGDPEHWGLTRSPPGRPK